MSALFARHALLPGGWQHEVLLEWDASGALARVEAGAQPRPGVEIAHLVLPGMVNLHSHAFQRALAGQTELASDGPDSFWTWRERMYRFARVITPEQVEAIAAQLYVECLRHGYTAVCEFHYLQRDPSGAFYPRVAELAERVVAAARNSGIGLTLLPVLYSQAGFGEVPLRPEQARFRTDVNDVLRIIEALEPLRDAQIEVGFAPHSLRAATLAQIDEVLRALPRARPVHLHIAEQEAEVAQAVAHFGRRPVELLLDEVAVDARFCLVHATHLVPDEIARLAASAAVVGLCPTTEANLGDGLFPLVEYLAAGGRIGIGSDSHASQSAVEELRWLEYGQRLWHRRRNLSSSSSERHVGDFLWSAAVEGGAQASGRPLGALEPGRRADLLVLDDSHVNLDGLPVEAVLGTVIFCGNDNLVRDVLVGGRWLVRAHRHLDEEAIAARYKRCLAELRRA